LAVPRRLPTRVALTCGRNGGEVSRRSISSSPWPVHGHHGWADRAGNRSRTSGVRCPPASSAVQVLLQGRQVVEVDLSRERNV